MPTFNTPEQESAGPEAQVDDSLPSQEGRRFRKAAEPPTDSLARFNSWRGFLFATVAVNLLFVYGMLGGMGDASLSIWYKTLIWLPFNLIATVIYLAIMARLGNAGWAFFRILSVIMIVTDWSILIAA